MNKVKTVLRSPRKLRAEKSGANFIYRDKYGNKGLRVYVKGKTKMIGKFARFCDNPHLEKQYEQRL